MFFLFKNLEQKTKGSDVVCVLLSEVLQGPNKQWETFQPLGFLFHMLPTTRFWKVLGQCRQQCGPPPKCPSTGSLSLLSAFTPPTPPAWMINHRRGSRAGGGTQNVVPEDPEFLTLGAWTAGATAFENPSNLMHRKPTSP